ncbi:hypothetical protein WL42_15270 [Burkholderia ubonensis]|nr:hypothetical protein WL42_15270 [Burkholderia ubonensis]
MVHFRAFDGQRYALVVLADTNPANLRRSAPSERKGSQGRAVMVASLTLDGIAPIRREIGKRATLAVTALRVGVRWPAKRARAHQVGFSTAGGGWILAQCAKPLLDPVISFCGLRHVTGSPVLIQVTKCALQLRPPDVNVSRTSELEGVAARGIFWTLTGFAHLSNYAGISCRCRRRNVPAIEAAHKIAGLSHVRPQLGGFSCVGP